MPRKPIELPEVAKAFAEDIKTYFAEPNLTKRDKIAALSCKRCALQFIEDFDHYGPAAPRRKSDF